MKLAGNSQDDRNLPRRTVHELNNIIFVLIGNLELILEDLESGHACRDFAQEALKAARRARDVLAALPDSRTAEVAARQEDCLEGGAAGRAARGEGIKVLLVDDEKMLLEALSLGLSNLGFQVHGCADPQQALALVRSEPGNFDVVVSDLIMPQMTGRDLAQQIVNTRQDLPIILMSGYQDDSSDQLAAQPGIGRVLAKPLRFRDLAAAIVHCVGSTTSE